jgi:hypothetical protein
MAVCQFIPCVCVCVCMCVCVWVPIWSRLSWNVCVCVCVSHHFKHFTEFCEIWYKRYAFRSHCTAMYELPTVRISSSSPFYRLTPVLPEVKAGGALMRLPFQRFFGLPRLRSPCGRLSPAIFARRLCSILPTWASHSLLRTSGPFNYVLNST